jgi:hypothetical protein
MGRSNHDENRRRVRQFAREWKTMTATFEETLISVWRQALVEDRKTVTLEGVHYPCPAHQPIQIAGDRFPVRRTDVARTRTKAEYEFALGPTGA